MKTKFFLTFYKSGLPKITKNLAPPSLGAIAVAVEAEIPDAYFTRPSVSAKISLPEPAAQEVLDATVIQNIEQALKEQLGPHVILSVAPIEGQE